MPDSATTPLDPVLGKLAFTDGSVRPIYFDDQGEPLYGRWLRDAEPNTPAVVAANAP
jgi:hypothetical protein